MRLTRTLAPALLFLAAGVAQAASAWGFSDGSVSVVAKKTGETATEKYAARDAPGERDRLLYANCASNHCRFSKGAPLSKPLTLGNTDTLKLTLVAKDNGKGKRPHQAFLVLQEQESGLEAPFPLTVKESGKAAVQIVGARLAGRLARIYC